VNPRFLHHYNSELVHLRHTAAEFAREYPKIAGRLAMDPNGRDGCPDPFVERLLEGFAFLSARIQVKFESEFPRFTQALLETVYPHYLSPLPSMLIAAFEPEYNDGGLADGYTIPRGTSLRSQLGAGQTTPCTFLTSQEIKLWPLEISEARYLTRELGALGLDPKWRSKAALRISLKVTAGLVAKALKTDELVFYIQGSGDIPYRIYEQIFTGARNVLLQSGAGRLKTSTVLPAGSLEPVGFKEEEALLPKSPRTFEGYRILREYFAFPQRFLFFKVTGLSSALRTITGGNFDLVIPLDTMDVQLENQVDASAFSLYCSPAINLFSKRLDRIPLTEKNSEFQVIPDRSRLLDFEVFEIESVVGIGGQPDEDQRFTPFYFNFDRELNAKAYYTTHRTARVRSAKERVKSDVSKYGGSDLYISLVDGNCAPWRPEITQLALQALCTNRHLPIQMQVGNMGNSQNSDFNTDLGGFIKSMRCLSGPTEPKPSCADGDQAGLAGDLSWRIISHLSLNYLSLVDNDPETGASALREMLRLYCSSKDASVERQIQGLLSLRTKPIVRRISTSGPIAFGRGLEVEMTFREAEFSGGGVFVMGAVLEQFLRKYVSINSFTEMVLRTTERGEIKRWQANPGTRSVF